MSMMRQGTTGDGFTLLQSTKQMDGTTQMFLILAAGAYLIFGAYVYVNQMYGLTRMFTLFGIIVFAFFGLYVFGNDMEPPTRVWYILATIGILCLVIWAYSSVWRSKEGYDQATAPVALNAAPIDASGTIMTPPDDGSRRGPVTLLRDIPVEGQSGYPYATDEVFPIRGVDDYEYNMVFQGEGDRAITKESRDALMNKYPRDWSTQPPSSELFQQGLAAFKQKQQEGFADGPQYVRAKDPYAQLDGPATPPDSQSAEEKERDILQNYQPQKPQSLTTYDAADANELVKRVYAAKGLVADMKQTQPNVFTITGTRKKDEKVLYEDELPADAPASTEAVPAAGEGVIEIPAVATTTDGATQPQDPFFNTDTPTRQGRWDYTKWTPGLERAFAPTQPQQNWY